MDLKHMEIKDLGILQKQVDQEIYNRRRITERRLEALESEYSMLANSLSEALNFIEREGLQFEG